MTQNPSSATVVSTTSSLAQRSQIGAVHQPGVWPGHGVFSELSSLLQKFREGDYLCKDKLRSGRSLVEDENELCCHIKQNPRVNTRDLKRASCTSHLTMMLALKKLGKVYKIGFWLPHQLDDSLRTRHVEACRIL